MAQTPQEIGLGRGWLSGMSNHAIAILTPEHPDHIPPGRHYRPEGYFERGELSRLVRDRRREAAKPLAAGEIAASIIAAKGFPDAAHLAVMKMVVSPLNALAGRGELTKAGKTRDARRVAMGDRA
ncbi:MAG TPA: hypothetical protein VKR31_02050 [Rhizomicrobium sp.]|nr:hypothetical protein [Rhizomicrobium sp.]